MRLHFLGTGGSLPIPMPTCTCGLCREAREQGAPYTRHGNSLYLDELNAMIDAPEFAYTNLTRGGIRDLDYVFLTHWHPDHINGLRVLHARDYATHARAEIGFQQFYRNTKPTLVTTRPVYERTCDLFSQLEYTVEELDYVDLHLLDEEPLHANGFEIRSLPYSLDGGEPDATGFAIERSETRVVVVSDDARYLDESAFPENIDTVVFECGLFEQGPDGKPLLTDDDREVLADELTHEEVLARIDRVNPEQAYLTEIGHQYARSYDDYRKLEQAYDSVRFAYDGLEVTV